MSCPHDINVSNQNAVEITIKDVCLNQQSNAMSYFMSHPLFLRVRMTPHK